jgi:hypothetical protein
VGFILKIIEREIKEKLLNVQQKEQEKKFLCVVVKEKENRNKNTAKSNQKFNFKLV